MGNQGSRSGRFPPGAVVSPMMRDVLGHEPPIPFSPSLISSAQPGTLLGPALAHSGPFPGPGSIGALGIKRPPFPPPGPGTSVMGVFQPEMAPQPNFSQQQQLRQKQQSEHVVQAGYYWTQLPASSLPLRSSSRSSVNASPFSQQQQQQQQEQRARSTSSVVVGASPVPGSSSTVPPSASPIPPGSLSAPRQPTPPRSAAPSLSEQHQHHHQQQPQQQQQQQQQKQQQQVHSVSHQSIPYPLPVTFDASPSEARSRALSLASVARPRSLSAFSAASTVATAPAPAIGPASSRPPPAGAPAPQVVPFADPTLAPSGISPSSSAGYSGSPYVWVYVGSGTPPPAHFRVRPGHFACPHCALVFPTEVQLALHAPQHAPSLLVSPPHRLPSEQAERSSARAEVPLSALWPCSICGRLLATPQELANHRQAQHGTGPAYVCPHTGCARRFEQPYQLRLHLRVHSQPSA